MKFFEKPISFDLTEEDVRNIIDKESTQVVSFDVFDTLLVRPSMEPRDIFCLLQNKVKEKYGLDFMALRYDAEQKLNNENATLEDIWDFIAKENKLTKKTAADLMQMEINLEIDMLQPQKDVYALYSYALSRHKRVIAVSDMYLTSAVLKCALDKNGYTDIEKIYVSCECGVRKSDGKLFDHVLLQENIKDPSSIVHIGDNYYSDYRTPLKKGIAAIYHSSLWDNLFSENSWWHELKAKGDFASDPGTRLLYSYTFLKYQTGRTSKTDHEMRRIPDLKDFSRYILAPMLVSIAKDLQFQKRKDAAYSQIAFAARDGYLPQKIYKQLNATGDLESFYLYVSRRALAFAEYRDFFEYFDDKGKMDVPYPLGSYICNALTDASLGKKICEGLTEEEQNIDLKSETEKARKVLRRFADELNRYWREQRQLALRYYNDIIKGGGRYLVFDCGYSGSVARGLKKACPQVQFDKYYLWQTEKNRDCDVQDHTSTICMSQNNVPFGFNIICEEFFSPLQGSCIGFKEQNGAVVPLFETETYSCDMRRDIEQAQQTCIDFAAAFRTRFADYWDSIRIEDKEIFERIYNAAFLETPYTNFSIFQNICFPDAYAREGNHTLEYKILQTYQDLNRFQDVFQSTRFSDPWYYKKPQDIRPSVETKNSGKIGIHLHMYYIHLYNEVIAYLREFPQKFDLIVTVPNRESAQVLKKAFTPFLIPALQKLVVLVVENRGRDVAPWLISTKPYQSKYDLFCHIHAKESFQYDSGEGNKWRCYLFDNLIEKSAIMDILQLFSSNEKLGCVFPACYRFISGLERNLSIPLVGDYGEEFIINDLIRKMGYEKAYCLSDNLFSVGTMLWYRPKALQPLFDLNLQYRDFPPEPIGVGGTIAHAIERMPALVARLNGYDTIVFNETNNGTDADVVRPASQPVNNRPFGLRGAVGIYLKKKLPTRTAEFLVKVFHLE